MNQKLMLSLAAAGGMLLCGAAHAQMAGTRSEPAPSRIGTWTTTDSLGNVVPNGTTPEKGTWMSTADMPVATPNGTASPGGWHLVYSNGHSSTSDIPDTVALNGAGGVPSSAMSHSQN